MESKVGNAHFGGRHASPRYLVELARDMRNNPTPAEAILWECLRMKRLLGMRFRFQHIIGRYIVDFFSYETKLVIEVDGNTHATTMEADQVRDENLHSQGYTVLRFSNDAVFHNLDSVLTIIESKRTP